MRCSNCMDFLIRIDEILMELGFVHFLHFNHSLQKDRVRVNLWLKVCIPFLFYVHVHVHVGCYVKWLRRYWIYFMLTRCKLVNLFKWHINIYKLFLADCHIYAKIIIKISWQVIIYIFTILVFKHNYFIDITFTCKS